MLPGLYSGWRSEGNTMREPLRPTVGASILSEEVWSRLGESLRLSDRELQIVQGIFEDQKQESIAGTLGISPHSVNTYMQRIYSKLRIGSRPQLIVRVMSEYLAFQANSPGDLKAP
jgi:DNA-binding CsgD family transcriptional regulator